MRLTDRVRVWESMRPDLFMAGRRGGVQSACDNRHGRRVRRPQPVLLPVTPHGRPMRHTPSHAGFGVAAVTRRLGPGAGRWRPTVAPEALLSPVNERRLRTRNVTLPSPVTLTVQPVGDAAVAVLLLPSMVAVLLLPRACR